MEHISYRYIEKGSQPKIISDKFALWISESNIENKYEINARGIVESCGIRDKNMFNGDKCEMMLEFLTRHITPKREGIYYMVNYMRNIYSEKDFNSLIMFAIKDNIRVDVMYNINTGNCDLIYYKYDRMWEEIDKENNGINLEYNMEDKLETYLDRRIASVKSGHTGHMNSGKQYISTGSIKYLNLFQDDI